MTNSYLNVSRVAFVPRMELDADARVERPWIWVRLGWLHLPFFLKTMERTSDGWPVLPIAAPAGQAVVLRWTGFELEPEDFRGALELWSARDAREADQALAHFGVPSWTFVFADVSGHVGYRAVGRVPGNEREVPFGIPRLSLARLRGLPSFTRVLDADTMPHVLDPERGFVATANNRQWPSTAPWRIGRAHSEGMRAFRIEELLQATPKHDLDSIRRAQCDVQAVDARFLLPGLLEAVGDARTERERTALAALRAWDGVAQGECVACPVFQRWLDRLLTDDGLDDTSLYRLLARARAGEREALGVRDDVRQAFETALDELAIRDGGGLPTWSALHVCAFQHLAGPERFAAEPLATPGDDQSVNPGSSEWEHGIFRQVTGASQRLIVELSDPPKVYSTLAGPNLDAEHRAPEVADSDWRRWVGCQQQRRPFPLDWSKVPSTHLAW